LIGPGFPVTPFHHSSCSIFHRLEPIYVIKSLVSIKRYEERKKISHQAEKKKGRHESRAPIYINTILKKEKKRKKTYLGLETCLEPLPPSCCSSRTLLPSCYLSLALTCLSLSSSVVGCGGIVVMWRIVDVAGVVWWYGDDVAAR
jgi:hypothetical protein